MQNANQIPFVVVSAERQGLNDHIHTAQLRQSLDIMGFNYKACLGHFEGSYENSFAVFLDSRDRDGLSETDAARAICDLALHHNQDSVLFVGPSDGVKGRRAYILDNDAMQTAIADHTLNVGEMIGHWQAVRMGDRHAYGDFTLDLLDSERAYVVQ